MRAYKYFILALIILITISASVCLAGQSTNYKITSEVLDGGGEEASSANYEVQGKSRGRAIDKPSSSLFELLEGFLNSVYTIFVPAEPPKIVYYSPTSEAINVLPLAKVTVSFDHDMKANTVENAFSLKAVLDNQSNSIDLPVSGSFGWPSGDTFDFAPASALSKGYTYQVSISTEAEDYQGKKLATPEAWAFRVIFDYNLQNIFKSWVDDTKVALAIGALRRDGYIDINRDPIHHPKEIDPSLINIANNKVLAEGNPYFFPIVSSITEYNAYDAADVRITEPFEALVRITLYYEDADNDGFVDGTSPPIQERGLVIYRLDEAHSLWIKMPGSTVNTEQNYVTCLVPRFSVYTLMATPAYSLADAYVFPNPYKPSELATKEVTFVNLASVCRIKIFTLTGDRVKTIIENDGDGKATWDVKNESGQDVASGLYLYVIESDKDVKQGKLIVIR